MAERSQTASEAGNDNGTDEIIAGNVSKFAAVPVGYYGSPKKGHLIFDACFESGNLGRVDHVSEFEYDLFIRPDTCNPRFRVWFNFTVENVKESQRVIFNIVNFSKTKSLYRDGMTPMVKSTSRPKWQRLPPKNVYYYRCPDHRKNYVMSFAFCFDREDDIYQFAYCYPYTYTRFQHYLDSLQKRNMDYFFRRDLGKLVQQRQLDLLTITSPGNLHDGAEQKVVFITGRIHPGETPSSFVCQGIIDFLVSHHPIARVLRDHLVFKIAPMLNPDGVYLGNYRKDPSRWSTPSGLKTDRDGRSLPAISQPDGPRPEPSTGGLFWGGGGASPMLVSPLLRAVKQRLLCERPQNLQPWELPLGGTAGSQHRILERSSPFPRDIRVLGEGYSPQGAPLCRRSCSQTAPNGRPSQEQGPPPTRTSASLPPFGSCHLGSHRKALNRLGLGGAAILAVKLYGRQRGLNAAASSLTRELSDMKLGRNVARTFMDYYRLNPIVEKVSYPVPRVRKEKSPPFKYSHVRAQTSSHSALKGDKKSSFNHKDHSQSS
ncbi:LOW QUALITY PROTEIN: cytosolic carboxypeptidase 6 [Sminthopsis crassicaudata]|uniref:LOW QUALITY PROTEIN: cytosolic carboxypeptidase 6 n=1 Tax=Sminthopsis crassicaudata TaxID=9301 RepID=UPI003D6867B6